MKISTKCRYGLRAMIYLAKANSSVPVKRMDISKAERIPHSFLENILLQLRKSGLIATTRGASGGFVLAKPADQITMNDIVETLEGSTAPVDCVIHPNSCNRIKGCEAHHLWAKLYQTQKKILESTTLQDLIGARSEEWVI